MTKKLRIIFCVFLFIGITAHIVPYIYNRSLWLDEAMLASSIVTRNLFNMINYPLDWGQSAPVGYLYIVKLITLIFGTSEFTLRVWSLISFLLSCSLLYIIMKSVLRIRCAEFFVLLFIFLSFYNIYSNELKPYMSDNMFVLLSILIAGLYYKDKLKFSFLIASYTIIIWFSFSAVFVIAAVMIMILIDLMTREKNKLFFVKFLLCMIVALSFALNYINWLSSTSSNAGAPDYWKLVKFIFIPSSIEDIKTLKFMLREIILPFVSIDYTFTFTLIMFALLGIFSAFKKKEQSRIYIIIPFSILLALIASSMGFFPVAARLMLFIPMEIMILSAAGFDVIYDKCWNEKTMPVFAVLVFMLGSVAFRRCLNSFFPSNVYMKGSEVAANVKYLKENLTPSDKIYVSRYAIPVFLYENKYSYIEPLHGEALTSKLPLEINNCILGQSTRKYYFNKPFSYDGYTDMNAIDEDISLIVKYPSVYIFSSHNELGVPVIIEKLKNYGTVQEVVSLHNNPLYHFLRKD